MRQAANFHGLPEVRSVLFPPPNIGAQTADEVRKHAKALFDKVVGELMRSMAAAKGAAKKRADPRKIVCTGDFDELSEFFLENRWTEGLPIVPPTIKAVEAMLKFTDRNPHEVVGVLRPGKCEATVWKIAVNGVMAGCRPEYMPILIAIIEAESEPDSGIEGFNSTSGQFPLIIVSGPITRELGFNHGQGMVKGNRQANIAISRFFSLCLINIACLRLGETDMTTFDRNFYPVIVESDESPWGPVSVDLGFAQDCNVVTVQSAATLGYSFLTEGEADSHLRIVAQEVARDLGNFDFIIHPMLGPATTPAILLSPLVATVIARAGYSKQDVRNYLFEKSRIPAHQIEEFMRRRALLPDIDPNDITLCEMARQGRLPKVFCENEDPDRMIPVVQNADEFMILVTGIPNRNRSRIMRQGGAHGKRFSKEIKLPANWSQLFRGRS